MENSQLETLKPCQNPPFTIHPYRRRPLQSNTYRVFAQIMSRCSALQQLKKQRESVEENKLVGVDGLGEAAKRSEPLDHDSVEIESLLVQQNLSGNVLKEAISHQGEDASVVEDNLLNSMTIITDDKNNNRAYSVMEDNQTINGISDPIISQKDSCNVEDNTEVSLTRLREVDKEILIDELPQAVNLSWEMDIIAEFSGHVMPDDEKKANEEKTFREGIEHELLLKEIELEKLIFSSTPMNSPNCDDIEEGEISGDVEIHSEATDFLFDKAVSLEKKTAEDAHKDIIDKEETSHDGGESYARTCAQSSSACLDAVDNGKYIMLERKSTIKDPNAYSEALVGGGDIEIEKLPEHGLNLEIGQVMDQYSEVQGTDHQAASVKELASCLQVNSEDRTKNKDLVASEKDNRVESKKRKRTLSKEQKAKKKKKDRIKRAEKNRKLGVKRLKLQPVLKPKTVTYCRHYLKGRCQEGEKCKFSHDTIPLTKSQPCRHFARHSCMKGDDCPFDHQLSKYPCNNYATTGYCSRGADCLFSHEMAEIGGHLSTSKVPKPESKTSFQTSDLNSKKQLKVHKNPPQTSSHMIAEKEITQILQRPITQVPKGISVFSHFGSSPGDTSKHVQAAQHLKKGDNGVKVGLNITSSSLDSGQKSNDMTKKTPTVKPKGINFLSFGKAPELDSGNKKNHGMSESFSCELSQSSSSKSSQENGGVKSENPSRRSFSKPESTKAKAQNSILSASRPQGIKFLSFAEVPGNNSRASGQGSSLWCDEKVGLPLVRERENGLDSFTSSNGMPCRSTPSSNPFCQSSYQTDPKNAVGMSCSQKISLLSNTPSSVHKALQSTLAFAAKFDSNIKLNEQTGTSRLQCWKSTGKSS